MSKDPDLAVCLRCFTEPERQRLIAGKDPFAVDAEEAS